jgi:DNA-binding IclR family transcriptional regulator
MRHPVVATVETPPAPSCRTPVKSAVRVLDILEALAASPDGVSFSDLGRRLHLPKSSLHGLLATLTDNGYANFDPEQRTYSLGIRVWEQGQAYSRHRDLLREARRVMEGIVTAVNETVQLAALDGNENVYLAKVDCSHPVRLQSEVGGRLPAHATGLGKVLLAGLPPETLRARLDEHSLAAFTPWTVTDRSALLAELDVTRAQGFGVDDQEYTWGCAASRRRSMSAAA